MMNLLFVSIVMLVTLRDVRNVMIIQEQLFVILVKSNIL